MAAQVAKWPMTPVLRKHMDDITRKWDAIYAREAADQKAKRLFAERIYSQLGHTIG